MIFLFPYPHYLLYTDKNKEGLTMDIALFDFDEHEAIIEPKKTHPPIEGFLNVS